MASAAAPVAAVVGVGPGLGMAVAKRFAKGGYHVAMMARDKGKLESAAQEIRSESGQATAISCDSGDVESVAAAFAQAQALGDLEVLVYNASGGGQWPPPKFMDTPLEKLQLSLQVNCVGSFLCCQAVVPGMLSRAKGTIIFTGATSALRGRAGFGAFAAGKSGQRALAQSLARELQPQGIHVAHVIIDGLIGTDQVKTMMASKNLPDDAFLAPEAIADAYWMLHSQHKSAWTHEMDLRPYAETF